MRKIINVESTSIGQTRKKNDDNWYIGENFVAVIDGVSSKSSIVINGEKVRIADIIVNAIKKLDRKNAPLYAKTLNLEEFTRAVNMYIKRFCDEHSISLKDNKLEATAAIYSKYYNQIWLVGDCRAVYDGIKIDNELKADELYAKIRYEIVNSLLKHGYTQDDIFKNDISKEIIKNPSKYIEYVNDKEEASRIAEFSKHTMYQALLDTGFSPEEIVKNKLLEKYIHPQLLQEYAKNNPNAGLYGYSVFNGIYTPIENCRIENLPDDVRSIRLSTDGFPMGILASAKNMGTAINRNRRLSLADPISISVNYEIHNSVERGDGHYLAFDDETAVDIRIEHVLEKTEDFDYKEVERDDER